ncbi:TetR/AcrR family transcriptional regulator [Streptomyces sp. XM4193]|uniref:TetR/AcrR family transcriptional regulator n=1 Tax=Streptomyces sp. XM4193 TaxID=2929782 RepID=UPI001FFA4C74|nr:TetR/AcrR family transcriptional regulator [Streptomyces sp. XM4193]MCK1797344.1 TetR/AcrR family transcriptional regulator [Streptomyces sp. XM4193]
MAQHEESSLPANLPPGVAVAWGLGSPPSKGPKRGLSTERIVAAAIDCAAREGVERLSMSRVAAALDVSTMALYRYVSAKSDLLVLMMDAATGRPPEDVGRQEGWRPALESWAHAQLEVFQRHVWMLGIPIGSPPVTPNSLAWMERGLHCLRDTGLEIEVKLSVMTLLSSYIRGEARLLADLEHSARANGTTVAAATVDYGVLLHRLTNPSDFPEITALLTARAFDEPGEVQDSFALGLDVVLAGTAALVEEAADRG